MHFSHCFFKRLAIFLLCLNLGQIYVIIFWFVLNYDDLCWPGCQGNEIPELLVDKTNVQCNFSFEVLMNEC